MNIDKNLKPFERHGTIFVGEAGSKNVKGHCVFCLEKNHFFVNVANQLWDCKKCGRSGNISKYLEEVVSFTKKELKLTSLKTLSKDRSLKEETLKEFEMGFNPITGMYCFPVYSADKKIIDVKSFKLGTAPSVTSGCNVGLFNSKTVATDRHNREIWITEGEWDCLTAFEILKETEHEVIPVSVPGAGTFKQEWINLFKGKSITLLFDNDKAGREGERKVYTLLKDITKQIKVVHWNATNPEGFDLRDFYKQNNLSAKKTFKALQSLIHSQPRIKEAHSSNSEAEDKAEENLKYGYGLNYVQVVDGYKKWLHLRDEEIINVMFGTVIANRLAGDPVWMFLVAPPSGSKTEMLMSLTDALNIYTATSLTPHALVSGASFGNGADPSLIPKLNGKVLVIKDFTTILNMPVVFREEVFGILRDAYDGRTEKIFGNGITRNYESKFGVLAGVTPAIDLLAHDQTALGERFLKCRFKNNGGEAEIAMIRKAISNINKENEMRAYINEIGKNTINYDFENHVPTIPEPIIEKTISLARLVALMRGAVIRERYTGDVILKPTPEVGTRLTKQFIKLGMGVAMFKRQDSLTDADFNTMKRVALDTIPERIHDLVFRLVRSKKRESFNLEECSNATNLPNATCSKILQDLTMLNAIKKDAKKSFKNEYTFTDSFFKLLTDSTTI